MPFKPLLTPNHTKPPSRGSDALKTQGNARKHQSTTRVKPSKRGCEYCPLNKIHGIHKIFGKVRGRKIFIWAQSPGAKENKKRKELVGPSGRFLWTELKKVGITRDQCDIQNVVRCWPVDVQKNIWPPFKMRAPNKQEIKCCSIYNEEALEKSKADLNLVFGQIAASILLGKELKKDQRVFYSEKMKGWVVYLDHPSYFIRQGFKPNDNKAPSTSLIRFRNDLKKAKQLLKGGKFDRYGFLKDQHYIGITTEEESNKAYKKLKHKAINEGIRLVADMEEGKVNEKGEPDENGTSVALCCGFSYKPGTTYVFALQHPDSGISEKAYQTNLRNVRSLFRDPRIKIAFQFGVSDTDAVKRLLQEKVWGYNYDTLLGEYFRDPDAKAYGLTAVANRRYTDFLDYKSIEGPEGFTPAFLELLQKKDKNGKLTLPQKVALGRTVNGINLARLPWKKIVLYNGADCHVTKLSERDTLKYVNQPLMQVYIDASFILYRMQRNRNCHPVFDFEWHKKVAKLYSLRVKKYRRRLKKLAGKYAYVTKPRKVKNKETGEIEEVVKTIKKKFNPDSPEQINWLLWEKLYPKYKFKGEKPHTRSKLLRELGQKKKYRHCNTVVEYREVTKAKGTYVDGYYKCAKRNKGRLRTIWKTTGTSTGRLSSGKTKEKSNDAVINFQNIHGDHLIKCLLISDKRWRKLYKYWLKYGNFTKKTWKKFQNLVVDLGFDFSQNELRELAEESGDKALIKAFSTKKKWYCKQCKELHGADPHVEVGHALTGWAREKIAHDDRVRKLVKNMQFGLVYGLQGEGLYLFLIAFGVDTTREEVDKYHAKYFKKYKGVKKLQKKYHNFAERYQYVINHFGFRRNINVQQQKEMGDEYEGAYWKNRAINTPIQGAAHQLLMMAIAALKRYPKKYRLLKYPDKEIHDALYFRVRLKYLWKAIKKGLELMLKEPIKIVERDFKLKKRVPLAAKPKAGFRFGVQVEGLGEGKLAHEWQFLNYWCEENKKLKESYIKQLAELEN